MKYRLAPVGVKQVDIHLEVAIQIYHIATKERKVAVGGETQPGWILIL